MINRRYFTRFLALLAAVPALARIEPTKIVIDPAVPGSDRTALQIINARGHVVATIPNAAPDSVYIVRGNRHWYIYTANDGKRWPL